MRYRGFVESVQDLEGDTLVIGWLINIDASLLLGLRATVDGEVVETVDARTEIDSPALAPSFPFSSRASRARFALRLRIRYAALPAHSLIRVLPVGMDGATSLGVSHVHRPSVDRPAEKDVSSIGGGFEVNAMEYLSYFIDLAGLRPDGAVLDVGCGIGRMAYGLSAFLSPRGRYVGFDVAPDLIEIAKRSYSAFPNFGFHCVNVQNPMYNPKGALDVGQVEFARFANPVHLVVMSSIITHLLPRAALHYLKETAKCLLPDGRAVVSAFVVDAEARHACLDAADTAVTHRLKWSQDAGCWVLNERLREAAVGYESGHMMAMLHEAGLAVVSAHAGSWSGKRPFLSYQDVLVLKRRP